MRVCQLSAQKSCLSKNYVLFKLYIKVCLQLNYFFRPLQMKYVSKIAY